VIKIQKRNPNGAATEKPVTAGSVTAAAVYIFTAPVNRTTGHTGRRQSLTVTVTAIRVPRQVGDRHMALRC
jgi:hypothetical protein